MTPNMIYLRIFSTSCFLIQPNFTNKYFIKSIINQVIDQFRFKPMLNNAPINPCFKSSKLELTNLALNIHITLFK